MLFEQLDQLQPDDLLLLSDLQKSKFTEGGLPMSMLHEEMAEKDAVLKAIMNGLNEEWSNSFRVESSFNGLINSISMSKKLTRSHSDCFRSTTRA